MGIPGNEKADLIANEATLSQSSIKINSIITSEPINNINKKKKKKIETWQNKCNSKNLLNKFMNVKPGIKNRSILLSI